MAVKPKLCMIPSGYKGGASSGDLYSVLPSDGVGDFDFSRSGSATRINKDGLIETVSSNVPRLNYPLIDGVVSGCPSLLLENSATNLVTYSEDFSQWNASNATVTSNQAISPNGDLNADELIESTSNSLHYLYTSVSATSNDYTYSVFVKKNTRNYAYIYFQTDGTNRRFGFLVDLNNGNITDTASQIPLNVDYKVINYGNGWYRCYIKATNTNGSVVSFIAPSKNSLISDINNSYQGDGTSGIYIWGAQVEQGSFPTSYIPSLTGSQTTRSAETCNNSGDANTFNDSEGVLFFEGSFIDNGVLAHVITISDGSNANVLFIGWTSSTSSFRVIVKSNSVPTCNLIITEVDVLDINKIALVYSNQNFELYSNGFLITSSNGINGGNTPLTLSTLQFDENGINKFYGNTKQIQYFDTALTDTDLEELTSWTSFNEMAESQLYSVY